MAEGRLRLRVALQRNGLPEHRFVLPVASGSAPTVSELLKLVSDLYMPLESEDWGLEDYVLELPNTDGTKSECLHFSPIRDVLKDDDQVIIRPLQDGDMKRRRLSGRHQISADGKRLVDGVPFGRPLLKTPRRPALHISPRKRRRLMYRDEDEEQEDQNHDRDMLLLTNGDHQNSDDDESFNDDSEYGQDDEDCEPSEINQDDQLDFDDNDKEDDSMDSINDADLTDELQALREDQIETSDNQPGQRRGLAKAKSSGRPASPQPIAIDPQSALQSAFTSAPSHVIERILTAVGGDLKAAYTNLLEAFQPSRSETATLAAVAGKDVSLSPPKRKPQPDVPLKKAPETTGDTQMDDDDDEEESEGDAGDDEEISDFVRRYDHQGLPPGTISSGFAGSFNSRGSGNSEATSTTLTGNKIIFRDEEDDNSEANADDKADTTSSSGTSSDNSDSDSDSDSNGDGASSWDGPESDEDDNAPRKPLGRGGSASSSSASSSSSDDDDDSGPEEQPIVSKGAQENDHPRVEISSDSDTSSDDSSEDESDGSSSDDSSDSDSSSDSENETRRNVTQKPQAQKSAEVAKQTPVPPGAGKESTKRRNQRRRAAKGGNKLSEQILDKKAEIEARRQALLAAIADGGVEIGSSREQEISSTKKDTAREKRKRNGDGGADSVEAGTTSQDENTAGMAVGTPKEASTMMSETVDTGDSADSSAKRRRVDAGAGRRLVFGALGLRNPKTKEDESTVRDKLMKGVKPLPNARLDQETPQTNMNTAEDQQDEEDPEAWREKITYRAVECCHEGVELSEPPFPFVQRWDPQQQNTWYHGKGNKRGGRGKRSQRNQDHFYDKQAGKKRKHDESADWDDDEYDDTYNGFEEEDEGCYLNYDDEEEPSTGAQDPATEASQFTDLDDLPSLPKDISALVSLRPGDVKPGMVITWKKWSCSPATNWAPQVSDVTAIVARIDDDATGLEVCLAKRDRYLDGPQKQYDSMTGQRVYDRFEAPDLDEDEDLDEEEDAGFRTLSFSEMMDPRIVQQPLDTGAGDAQVDDQPNVSGGVESSKEQDQEQQVHGESPPTSKQATGVDVSEEKQVSSKDSKAASGSTEHQPGQGHHHTYTPDIAISDESQIQDPLTLPSSVYRGDLDTEMTVNIDIASDQPQSTKPSSPPPPSSDPNFGGDDDVCEVMTGTPHIIYPKLIQPSAPASSVASGRQPDDAMDMYVQDAGSLHATEEEVEVEEEEEESQYKQDEEVGGHGESTILGASQLPWSEGEMNMDKSPEPPSTIAPKSEKKSQKSQKIIPSSPASVSSDDSLESLNTVWCTARSRRTQSPSRAPVSPIKPKKNIKDLEYEEAMRRLDEMCAAEEEEEDNAHDSIIPDSYPAQLEKQQHQQQPKSSTLGEPVIESPLIRTTRRRSRAASTMSPAPLLPLPLSSKRDSAMSSSQKKKPQQQQPSSQTSNPPTKSNKKKILPPPPGSHIVDLLSSSDAEAGAGAEEAEEEEEEEDLEPIFTENYADEDEDETYSPASLSRRINTALSSSSSSWTRRRKTTTPAASSSSRPIPSHLSIMMIGRGKEGKRKGST